MANQSNKLDDTAEIDPSSLAGCLPTSFIYRGGGSEEFFPGTFGEKTYVYNSIRVGAKIIDTLTFNTPVNVLKEYTEFYLVCTPKRKSGYIKKSDLYLNKIFNSEGPSDYYYYLVGLTKYPPTKELVENSLTCKTSILKIVKIDQKSSKILDVYTDSVMGANYIIKKINSLALKNTTALFNISYGCMHDIETDEDLYIVDNGQKLSRLFFTSLSGDGGYGDGDNIFLPVKLADNEKIVLAKNGVVSLNSATTKPEIIPYPVSCGIPIDELVVVQNWSEEDTDDDEGKPKQNKDGTAIDPITITSTSYYRWNGNTLTQIKTIKGK